MERNKTKLQREKKNVIIRRMRENKIQEQGDERNQNQKREDKRTEGEERAR